METATNRKYILACSLFKKSTDSMMRSLANGVLIDMSLPESTIDEIVTFFEKTPSDKLTVFEKKLRDFARSIDLTNPPQQVG